MGRVCWETSCHFRDHRHHHHHHHHFHCKLRGWGLLVTIQRRPLHRLQARRRTDRQTDRRDRPDQTKTKPTDQPPPQNTPRAHRRCTGKRAPSAKSQNPTYLDTKMADKKRVCVCPACTSLVEKNSTATYHQGQGRSPFPTSTHTR